MHLTPLGAHASRARPLGTIAGELRLLAKGREWWWYAGAAGILLAGALKPSDPGASGVLPLAFLWAMLALSAAKFVLVVGFYMHLRFDHPLFTGVFGFGLAVAASVITALLFLFGQYPLPIHHE